MEDKFYKHDEEVHNDRAPKEVVPIIIDLIQPQSVIDVGCGIGTWLTVFEERGVRDIKGVDGSYVNLNQLKIKADKFQSHDLQTPLILDRKFDLAICLEVAEHLSESSANVIVNSLVNSSDIVFFSAAIPGQGGQYHINEQWLSYWKVKFEKNGYALHDVIRPKLWNNSNVDVWYKQNMVLFCKKGIPLEERLLKLTSTCVDIVHPDLFEFYFRQSQRATLIEEGKAGMRLALASAWKAFINMFK